MQILLLLLQRRPQRCLLKSSGDHGSDTLSSASLAPTCPQPSQSFDLPRPPGLQNNMKSQRLPSAGSLSTWASIREVLCAPHPHPSVPSLGLEHRKLLEQGAAQMCLVRWCRKDTSTAATLCPKPMGTQGQWTSPKPSTKEPWG